MAALAVNLNQGDSVAGGAQAVDTAAYRSSAGRHKVLIHQENSDRAKSVASSRALNYGAFQVLEVDRATADRLIASGAAENADGQNLILFNTGAVDTTAPAVFANRGKALTLGSDKQLHLVQFPGPIKPEWYAQLEATGAQIVNAIPSNAYLVYGDAVALDKVAALANDGVAQWQGPYLPAYKIQQGVAEAMRGESVKSMRARRGNGRDILSPAKPPSYRVQLVRDSLTNSMTESLFAGAPVISRYQIANYINLVVTVSPDVVDALSRRPDVVSISVYVAPQRMDERQDMIMAGNLTGNTPNAGNYLTTLANWGFTQAQFTASGLVVDVADDGADRNPTGADPGTIAENANAGPVQPRHFLLRQGGTVAGTSRFLYKGRWRTDMQADISDGGLGFSGHGQLNMSIIGGYVPDSLDVGGTRVHRDPQGFRYGLGVAPFVGLGNSVIFDPEFTAPDYGNMTSAAYAQGARISSNSWGGDNQGGYDSDAQTYDILTRDAQAASGGNQQLLFVFAAGNAGPGPSTVGTPGTGKNVLTVGAAENVHSHATANGGNAGNTAGNDGCASPDTEADSAADMAIFSSRGPTADGRRKPDIVAPGTHVTGMTYVATGQDPASPLNGAATADAGYRADGVCAMPPGTPADPANRFFPVTPTQRWYTTSSGTSHSTPAAAGAAALIYQQFINNPAYIGANRTPAGSAGPSPAMVKAYLANSARYMTGWGANDTLPSNSQGMGAVNLGTAFDGTPRIIRDQDAGDRFTASGQVRTFVATVSSASAPLRVTLAYSDKQGPTSGASYINNLDLTVTVNGLVYRGNVFAGANSVTGGAADTRNNVESVFLPAGIPVGTPVAIRVTATNIAAQADTTVAGVNQDFALVVYNANPASSQAALAYVASAIPTGNGAIDPNECNDLTVSLANNGQAGATALSATLASATAGVTITQANTTYADIAAGATGNSIAAFKVSTAPSVVCGSTINFTQTTTFAGGTSPVSSVFTLNVGSPANATIFAQNFDAVTAPTLPAGWTTARTGTTPPAFWATTTSSPDSAPNAASTSGVGTAATNSLISPAIALPSSPFPTTLSFRHRWSFEYSINDAQAYDGGILELSTDGGTTFNNVVHPSVGGVFTANGPNYAISYYDTNPLATEHGWSGTQATYVTSTLTLPVALNGQTIKLRWRGGWDSVTANAGANWRIDGISLTGGVTCTAGSGVCVAPSNTPPTLAYNPTPTNPVNFTVSGLAGTGSIAVTPSGGTGSGAAATSTVTGCTVSGPDAASFSGAGAVNLSFVGATTTPQPISLNCAASNTTARSATLSCSETIGSNPATARTWPLNCPVGCALDINGDSAVTAQEDGVLLARYLLGLRGAALVADVTLGAGRPNAAAVEAFIGSGSQYDVFGRPVAAANVMQDSAVLLRLMLGVPDSGLLNGIAVPAGAVHTTASAVRANVNARCGSAY